MREQISMSVWKCVQLVWIGGDCWALAVVCAIFSAILLGDLISSQHFFFQKIPKRIPSISPPEEAILARFRYVVPIASFPDKRSLQSHTVTLNTQNCIHVINSKITHISQKQVKCCVLLFHYLHEMEKQCLFLFTYKSFLGGVLLTVVFNTFFRAHSLIFPLALISLQPSWTRVISLLSHSETHYDGNKLLPTGSQS